MVKQKEMCQEPAFGIPEVQLPLETTSHSPEPHPAAPAGKGRDEGQPASAPKTGVGLRGQAGGPALLPSRLHAQVSTGEHRRAAGHVPV